MDDYIACRNLLFLSCHETMNSSIHQGLFMLKRMQDFKCNCENSNESGEGAHVVAEASMRSNRLVLLHHAQKCLHEGNGRCPSTPFCWGLKTLWVHLLKCKNDLCPVLHCCSSRCVLKHYSKCIFKSTCEVCKSCHMRVKEKSTVSECRK
jgi:hypothetical protein